MLYDPRREGDPRPDSYPTIVAWAVAAISVAFAFVILLSGDNVCVTTISAHETAASAPMARDRLIFIYR